jgi:hypothetical protein
MSATEGAAIDDESPFEVVLPPQGGGCADGACSAAPQLRYRPLHRSLFGAEFRREWLDASFAAAIADGGEAAIRAVLREEVPGRVFSFPMLTDAFCALLLAELEAYEASGLPVHRPNTMNNYGARARVVAGGAGGVAARPRPTSARSIARPGPHAPRAPCVAAPHPAVRSAHEQV